MDFTKDTLWSLRKEIKLNSIFYSDFYNSFGIDEKVCGDFFDGYANFLQGMMEDDGHDDADSEYFEYLKEYDNPDNLWEWYLCHTDDCLPIDAERASDKLYADGDNALVDLVCSKGWSDRDADSKYTAIVDCIMKKVDEMEKEYPELKSEDDGDEKWYDSTREILMARYVKF